MTNIDREKPMVVAVCEVKPKNSNDRQLLDYAIPGYSIHPVNLDDNTGRGIAVFTHESIDKSVIQIKPEFKFDEACLLEIRLRGGDLMCFGCIYRSPTLSDTSAENNESLNNLLRCITKKNYSHICIVGDLNYRDINWEAHSTPHGENSKEAKFIETARDCFLHQHIKNPTRRRGNDEPTLLDLVLTDEVMQVSDIGHHAPLGKSDHFVITFKFHCYLDYSKDKESFSYGKADYDGMRQYLTDTKWLEKFVENFVNAEDCSTEEVWKNIKSMILELREKYVPKTSPKGKSVWKRKGTIPIDKLLQDEIHRKKVFHRKWMNAKNREDEDVARALYTKSRNKVKRMMRQAKKRYEKNICLKSKVNPKLFWAHVRRMLKTKSGVAPLLSDKTDKNSTKFDDKEKADILQEQFSSVFTCEPEGDVPQLTKRTDALLKDLKITAERVKVELVKLNPNKSCGPDEIHPRMLKELTDQIALPMAFLLNTTMEKKEIPADWKNAYVSPIFKKGARNIAANYRPISLTSIPCKIMESIVKEAVLKHMVENNLLSPKQFGFLSGRSTVTQLLKYLNQCVDTLVNGGVVDAIYLDFAKAFDTVPHSRLLGKLRSYGIDGNILKWIEAFLRDRTQIVRVNGENSFQAPVLSGIPQGSVLGPLLFVIYINDLPDSITSDSFLFADDTKILRKITSAEDSITLQNDLKTLEEWSNEWLLRFNADKCHVLSLGKIEHIKHTHRYELYGEELDHVFEETDLGVTIDSELKFEDHISKKVSKANSIVGLIRRSFTHLDGELFKRLYTTFVRPHLEYAQSVWSPISQKLIDMIENVQKRATKMIDGFGSLTYQERLQRLDLPTLVYRRARGDMIEVFKHFHSYDQSLIPDVFKRQTYGIRNNGWQLVWRCPKDGVRGIQANSFYYRIIETWNGLPAEVVNAPTINTFKARLDREWTNLPTKFNPKTSQSSS